MTTLLNYINALKWFVLIVFVMIAFRRQIVGVLNRLTSLKVTVGGAQVEVDSSAPMARSTRNSSTVRDNAIALNPSGEQVAFHQTNYISRPPQSKLEVRVSRWISLGGYLFVEFEAINLTGNQIDDLVASATLTIGSGTFSNLHIAFPGTIPVGGSVFQFELITDSATIDETSEMEVAVTSTSKYSIVN
ncbi:MAG: hypothetical protein M0019_10820 [Actinomycetota bacterium]|nr:hypothetical protein [Actinomycetota bacterium]